MSQLPAMPMWWSSFFDKTDHLSNEEQWAYAKLMAKTWLRNCQPFPDNPADLARVLGMTVKKWLKIRDRIAPFFDLTEGVWRQSRLEKEFAFVAQRAGVSRRNGALGGRPKSSNINGEENTAGSGQATQGEPTYTYTYKEDSFVGSEREPTNRVRAEESDAEGGGKQAEVEFEAWWQRYPNKVGKGAARTKFAIARRKASQQTLLDGVDGYIATKPPDRNWCNPQTWLNQERWLDQPAAPDEIPEEGPLIEGVWQSLDDKWTTAVKHWRGGKRWVESLWGPAPGDPGCQIPSKYLIEEVA